MTRSRTGPAVHGALATIVASALLGCATPTFPAPPPAVVPTATVDTDPDRAGAAGPILVLLGSPGAMRLAWLGGSAERPLALPDGDVTWVAGDPAVGLVATVGADGRLFVSAAPGQSGTPRWAELRLDPLVRGRNGRPLAAATMNGDGRTIVAVAADPGSGRDVDRLVVIDRTGGDRTVQLQGAWDGGPPGWLGPDRVAVVTRDATDRPTPVAIDLESGGGRRWGGPAVGALAVSADGSTVAWQTRDDGRISAGDATIAESGGPLEPVVLPDGRGPVAAQLLLDRTGRRIAVAWLDEAGDTSAVTVYRRTAAGWVEAGAPRLPAGTTRLVLVSLGP